ncbi:hypothetical protein D3C87_1650020 [compost metagenome]
MLLQQVLAVVECRGVGEGRQGNQLAVNGLRLDDRGEVVPHDVLGRLGQVEELIGELRSPDHVGLIDVDVGIAGSKPQTILAELVSGRRGHRHHGHGVAGFRLEAVELAAQERQAIAGVAGNDRQLGCLGHAGHQGNARHHRNEQRFQFHWKSSRK